MASSFLLFLSPGENFSGLFPICRIERTPAVISSGAHEKERPDPGRSLGLLRRYQRGDQRGKGACATQVARKLLSPEDVIAAVVWVTCAGMTSEIFLWT